MIKLMGTDLESLLTWGSSKGLLAKVHLCEEECPGESAGPGLIHCRRLRGIGALGELADLPWRDVLVSAVEVGGDELAGLRERMEGLPAAAAPPGGRHEKEAKRDEGGKKEKKKRKKKRGEGEARARPNGSQGREIEARQSLQRRRRQQKRR